jgi:hypothetical protein
VVRLDEDGRSRDPAEQAQLGRWRAAAVGGVKAHVDALGVDGDLHFGLDATEAGEEHVAQLLLEVVDGKAHGPARQRVVGPFDERPHFLKGGSGGFYFGK